MTFTAGADVVVGMGHHTGCTNDQEAAFYVETPPATHNISGLGGTFVLGHDAKLVVTNETGSPKLRFNQRYVHASDTGTAPSFGVSIVSVNGVVVSGPDGAGKYVLGPLNVPGVVEVPASWWEPPTTEWLRPKRLWCRRVRRGINRRDSPASRARRRRR